MLWEPGPVLSFIRIIVYLYFIIEFVPGLKLLTHWLLGASQDTPPLLFLGLPRQPGSPLTFVLCSHQQGPPQRALCGNRAWPFLSPSSSPSTPWPSTQPHVFAPLEFSFCKALFLSRLTCSFPLPNTHLSSLFSLVCTCGFTCALSTLPVGHTCPAVFPSLMAACAPLMVMDMPLGELCGCACAICTCPSLSVHLPCVPSWTLFFLHLKIVFFQQSHMHPPCTLSHTFPQFPSGGAIHIWVYITLTLLSFALWSTLGPHSKSSSIKCSLRFCIFLREGREKKWDRFGELLAVGSW